MINYKIITSINSRMTSFFNDESIFDAKFDKISLCLFFSLSLDFNKIPIFSIIISVIE